MLILFDFDGTIADTLPHIIEIVNSYAPKYNFDPVNPSELGKLREMTIKELLKKFHISLVKFLFFNNKVRSDLAGRMEMVRPFSGMREILRDLKKAGYRMGIVTSNSRSNVEIFLKKYQMQDEFEFVHSEKNVFGKHRILKKVIKNAGIEMADAIYIGDEVRDIEACRKINLKIISVTWGFNGQNILSRFKPDYLVKTPAELMTALSESMKDRTNLI